MKISNAERALLVDELRRIATRLAGAPEHTEQLARSAMKAAEQRAPDVYRNSGLTHYPYQVGGLEQICTGTARDLEAIIRRLGGGS